MPIARAPICKHQTYAESCPKCAEARREEMAASRLKYRPPVEVEEEDDDGFEIEFDIDLGDWEEEDDTTNDAITLAK